MQSAQSLFLIGFEAQGVVLTAKIKFIGSGGNERPSRALTFPSNDKRIMSLPKNSGDSDKRQNSC